MNRKKFLLSITGLSTLLFFGCKPKIQENPPLIYTAYLCNGTIYLTADPSRFDQSIIQCAEQVAIYSLDTKTGTLTKISEAKTERDE